MFKEFIKFLRRHSSLIITTHDWPDADGLGAEIAFSQICRDIGIKCYIINSKPVPHRYVFLDPEREIGTWENTGDTFNPKEHAMVILDSSDEFNIGTMKDIIPLAKEVFMVDHHDHAPAISIKCMIDSSASSTCEIISELAEATGVTLNMVSSSAVYAGIAYDTGSFAFPKTSNRTFRAALKLVDAGVNPYAIYHELNETAETGALLLNQRVFSSLKIIDNRIAVQILRKEDMEATGTNIEDAEAFINIPLKAREIQVSVLVKETSEGQVRCSLRSKGKINVSRIAQIFGGGGHVTASGFRSSLGIEETLARVLEKIRFAPEQ